MRIGEFSRMPTAAMTPAMTMKARKLPDSSADSEVRAVSSSQTTASAGAPSAARSASTARSETATSTSSTAIEPSCSSPM